MVDPGTAIMAPDVLHEFSTRDEASLAAADQIAQRLSHRLSHGAEVSMVATGGSSPRPCYSALAATELPWDRVHVVLSDERWVPPTHADSNEQMIRGALMTGNATAVNLHPLYQDDVDISDQALAYAQTLSTLPRPFAACLLGMGEDGHVASLFVDADNFLAGVDAESSRMVIPIKTAASAQARISLTLAALLQSDEILLLFYGEEKLSVYREAKRSATAAYPVSRLLHQNTVPVAAYWAP